MTAWSVTGATFRVRVKFPTRPSVSSGRTSTTSSNSTGCPASNLRFRTEGSATGWSDWLLFASSQPSRITSSSTHCRISWLNRRRTTASGALPGRKPGSRARRAYWRTAFSSASWTRSTGTETRSALEAASSAVVVTVMMLMVREI